MDTIRISHLLVACHIYPFYFLAIASRLASGQYTNISQFSIWLGIIQTKERLIDQIFAMTPFWWRLERFNISISVEKFEHGELRSILINSLRRLPADFLVAFLRSFKRRTDEKITQRLLNKVLQGDSYFPMMRRSSPSAVPPFLKYVEKFDKEKAKELLRVVIDDDVYVSNLARSSPSVVLPLLKYVEKFDKEKAKIMVRVVIGDDVYISRLCRLTSKVANLLQYYVEKYHNVKSQESIEDNILLDDVYIPNLRCLKPSDLGNFLYMLAVYSDKNFAQKLMEEILCNIALEKFKDNLSILGKGELAVLRERIRDAKLQLPPEFWEVLIKLSVGNRYRPPCPDPDFPQDKLFRMPVFQLAKLLKHLSEIERNRYKMICIIHSLISDRHKLEHWLKSMNQTDAILLRDTIETINLRIPEELWETLVSRC